MFSVNILIYHVARLSKSVQVLTERREHPGSDCRSLCGWGQGPVVPFDALCPSAFLSVPHDKEGGADLS